MAQRLHCPIVVCLFAGCGWVCAADGEPVHYGGRTAAEWAAVLDEQLGEDSEQAKELCRQAAAALGQIGPAAEVAVPQLAAALQSPSLEVRHFAVDALGRIGAAAAGAVPAIVAEMDLPPEHVNYAPLAPYRRLAARALGHIGPAARAAVPALGRALQNEDPGYRIEAALALWRILQQPRAVDYLAGLVGPTDSSGNPAYEAVMALGETGSAAAAATDTLVAALAHNHRDVQRAAADVLVRLGPEVIEPVAGRLQQGDLSWPAPTAYVLGALAEPLRQEVFYGADTHAAAFRTAAEPLVRSAIPALITLLGDPRSPVRQTAQRSLSQMGLLAVPMLLEALTAPDESVRQAAAETLIRTERHLPPANVENQPLRALKQTVLSQLTTLMDATDPQTRAAVYRSFAEIPFGSQGREALPLLRRGLRDENLAVRKYASQAIRALDGE